MSRALSLLSALLVLGGLVALVMGLSGVFDSTLGVVVGLALIGLATLLTLFLVLRVVVNLQKDLRLVRDRSRKSENRLSRISEVVDELRTEILEGPHSHVPGQIGRIEAILGAGTERPRPLERVAKSTVNEVFDGVYVINLDRDPDKLAEMTELLGAFGIRFQRFKAVDGADPGLDREWSEYVDRGASLPQERATGRRLVESPGAWAYLRTLETLLVEAKASGRQSVLVFDDDVLFHREFDQMFAVAWAEVPDDWMAVYLGAVQALPGTGTPYSGHLRLTDSGANGSYAVAIHAAAFDQLIASVRRMDWPFDAGALRELDASYPGRVLAADPPLVIADVSRSAIRPPRDFEAHAAKHGFIISDYLRHPPGSTESRT